MELAFRLVVDLFHMVLRFLILLVLVLALRILIRMLVLELSSLEVVVEEEQM